MATEQTQKPTVTVIDIEEISAPGRTEKLHPVENQDQEEWADFLNSVGTEPDKPLDVRVSNDEYELIDGDRRLRALKENGAKSVQCYVHTEMSDDDFYLRRVRANEHRKDSDPIQRSWYTAQFVAPWLLPAGERWYDAQQMDQSEYGDLVGKAQGTISNWLKPMQDEHPIRHVVGKKKTVSGNPLSQDDIKKVDDIVNWLCGRSDTKRVVPRNNEGQLADEIESMKGVSLGEIHSASKKAANESWNMNSLLEHLKEAYVSSDNGPSVSGTVNSGIVNKDTTRTDEKNDGNPDQVSPAETMGEEGYGKREEGPDWETYNDEVNGDQPELPIPDMPDVDWAEYVADEDLQDDVTVEQIAQNRKLVAGVPLKGNAAVALNMVMERYDVKQSEAIEFFWSAIVEEAIDHFAE